MKGKKILVIDDDNDLREALVDALTAAGFTVLNEANGSDGVSTALRENPDLILLDLLMPRMDGHQVLERLRRDAWGKNAHVLLLTSLDDAANIARGVSNKSADYIIKSQTSLAEIVKKVKQHLAGYL